MAKVPVHCRAVYLCCGKVGNLKLTVDVLYRLSRFTRWMWVRICTPMVILLENSFERFSSVR